MLFHGASDAAIHDFFKVQTDYDQKTTQEKIESLKQNRKPVKCETLRKYGGEKVKTLCASCDTTRYTKKEKDESVQTSFLLLPEGKLAEEVYNDNGARLALWNGNSVEYMEEVRNDKNDRTYRPLVNDAITTGAVKLPTCAQEYGTPQELIDALQSHIHRYLDISNDMEVFATWYVLLSWVYDRVNTLPYLRAMGDTGCGKSRFLDVIGGVCYKACMVSGAITPAPIYRMIRQWGGTIVLDEADFRDSNEKNEVITILNCGFEKNRPVIRCDQNNVDNLQFLPTYCPKVIATRYTFSDKALESRCLTEKMTQTDRKDIPRVLPIKFYEEQQELRNRLLMFRFRHYYLIDGDAGQGLDFGNIEPRLQQATQSFAALFYKVPELMQRFKSFLEQYNKELIEERSESFDGMIVQTLNKLHEEGMKDISSKDIANRMIEDFGLEKVSPPSIGKHLKSLKIETYRQGTTGSRRIRWDDKLMAKIVQRYTINDKNMIGDSSDSTDKNSRGELKIVTNNNCKKSAPSSDNNSLSPMFPVGAVTTVMHIVSEEKQSIEHACKEWEQHNGSINSSNLYGFLEWYCKEKDPTKTPLEIKGIVEHLIGVTPATGDNGNGSEDSDQKKPQHPCSFCGAIPAKNTSESSLGIKEYYCAPCYKNICEKRGAKV